MTNFFQQNPKSKKHWDSKHKKIVSPPLVVCLVLRWLAVPVWCCCVTGRNVSEAEVDGGALLPSCLVGFLVCNAAASTSIEYLQWPQWIFLRCLCWKLHTGEFWLISFFCNTSIHELWFVKKKFNDLFSIICQQNFELFWNIYKCFLFHGGLHWWRFLTEESGLHTKNAH